MVINLKNKLPISFAIAVILASVSYFDALAYMFNRWMTYEEYSHGIIIPFLSLYILWLRRDQMSLVKWSPSWGGLVIVVVSLLINYMARMASVFSIQQYSYVFTLYGLVICFGGWALFRALSVPLVLLMFMVPIPVFFMNNLSAHLQLLSSKLGVFFIRAAGISVFLEGNVIDLGVYKLQVAEACSGLRYLFPLMTMSFLMAYLFKATLWKRLIVFVSSIPLTLVMNSLRIGAIGILVEYFGISMAEGFLHDFEGWVVFMCSCAVLLLEVRVLSGLGTSASSWRAVLNGFQEQMAASSYVQQPVYSSGLDKSRLSFPVLSVLFILVISIPLTFALTTKAEAIPLRKSFVEFPSQIGSWVGHRSSMDVIYLDTLQLDDYIISDFIDKNNSTDPQIINFYSAWYNSQRAGQSAHSPRTCLPGGGWIMNTLEQIEFSDVLVAGHPLQVNRSIIVNGNKKQLVYYWFQQRGRTITNEYLVKWYLFVDSLMRQRTDGALVRLVVPVDDSHSLKQAEEILQGFVRTLMPTLEPYIPN